ncbi:DoxX family protein [Nocardia concava]|uniref:DoxX family protein n=1 Tax=Nocardia concava TaxID=257281 RepID=UPI000315ED9E|nr:DoxX family protein [Nocardia concava]
MTAIAHSPSIQTAPSTRARLRTYAYWAATLTLAFTMTSGAYGEFTHQYGTLETHTILGYPTYFLTLIATWKVLGSAAILAPGFPRLKEWAYAGMFFNMSGAFISHLVQHDNGAAGMHLIATGGILALVVASWSLRPQSRTLPSH